MNQPNDAIKRTINGFKKKNETLENPQRWEPDHKILGTISRMKTYTENQRRNYTKHTDLLNEQSTTE